LHFLSSRHVEVQHMMGLELLVSYMPTPIAIVS